jgi:hypothetical protein
MTDDRVIDIRRYLGPEPARDEPGAFGVWGGVGERSRFALPVWRSIYLAGGDWGGIVYLPESDEPVGEAGETPPSGSLFFALDLQADPARTESPLLPYADFKGDLPPAIHRTPDAGLAVLLGNSRGRWWFLLIQGDGSATVPEGKDLETLLFLAGECSGLLFLHGLEEDLSTKE